MAVEALLKSPRLSRRSVLNLLRGRVDEGARKAMEPITDSAAQTFGEAADTLQQGAQPVFDEVNKAGAALYGNTDKPVQGLEETLGIKRDVGNRENGRTGESSGNDQVVFPAVSNDGFEELSEDVYGLDAISPEGFFPEYATGSVRVTTQAAAKLDGTYLRPASQSAKATHNLGSNSNRTGQLPPIVGGAIAGFSLGLGLPDKSDGGYSRRSFVRGFVGAGAGAVVGGAIGGIVPVSANQATNTANLVSNNGGKDRFSPAGRPGNAVSDDREDPGDGGGGGGKGTPEPGAAATAEAAPPRPLVMTLKTVQGLAQKNGPLSENEYITRPLDAMFEGQVFVGATGQMENRYATTDARYNRVAIIDQVPDAAALSGTDGQPLVLIDPQINRPVAGNALIYAQRDGSFVATPLLYPGRVQTNGHMVDVNAVFNWVQQGNEWRPEVILINSNGDVIRRQPLPLIHLRPNQIVYFSHELGRYVTEELELDESGKNFRVKSGSLHVLEGGGFEQIVPAAEKQPTAVALAATSTATATDTATGVPATEAATAVPTDRPTDAPPATDIPITAFPTLTRTPTRKPTNPPTPRPPTATPKPKAPEAAEIAPEQQHQARFEAVLPALKLPSPDAKVEISGVNTPYKMILLTGGEFGFNPDQISRIQRAFELINSWDQVKGLSTIGELGNQRVFLLYNVASQFMYQGNWAEPTYFKANDDIRYWYEKYKTQVQKDPTIMGAIRLNNAMVIPEPYKNNPEDNADFLVELVVHEKNRHRVLQEGYSLDNKQKFNKKTWEYDMEWLEARRDVMGDHAKIIEYFFNSNI